MAKRITIALAGNPNSGKTTLFNNLTGMHQHVGNWPGVTVEKKEGVCRYRDYEIKVVDLPGVYSLTAYSVDELIARNFILDGKSDVIVDVVDGTNLERNLYLTVQLLELGAKVVMALNMMDEVASRNHRIDVRRLSELLKIPVVPTIANKNKGTKELLDAVIDVAEGRVEVGGIRLNYGKDIEEELSKLEKLILETPLASKYPARWLALKLLENDEEVIRKFREGV